ncbi:MAG: DUF2865 domain-containing protein [Alphaproteobacteria bacterium]|nr:DUF2865 domain-containing protein [Alphaproteobacteria bacterium]
MAAGPFGLRGIAAMAALCAALAGSALPTAAASRVCRQLEAELAATYKPTASSAQLRRQDGSIGKQREQLQLARKRARQEGCGFSLFGRGDKKCAALNGKIEKMERNLDALQRKRTQMARGSSGGKSRAKIIAALDANGCRDGTTEARRLPGGIDRNRNILDQIFGGPIRQRDNAADNVVRRPLKEGEGKKLGVLKPRDGQWINENGQIRFTAPPGNYRTLCVRTCDGYFFPMSNASSPMDFDRDQKRCEASCPGTEVQLYYHDARDEESGDMVSPGSGAPYSELPTAYLYKQAGVPSPANCACSRQKEFEVIAARPAPGANATETPETAPEVQAPSSIITFGGRQGADKAAEHPVAPEREVNDEDRKVRVVAPSFLPDPGEAIDLQAPGQTQVQ